jgi:arylsulfatase A-like enzyme
MKSADQNIIIIIRGDGHMQEIHLSKGGNVKPISGGVSDPFIVHWPKGIQI